MTHPNTIADFSNYNLPLLGETLPGAVASALTITTFNPATDRFLFWRMARAVVIGVSFSYITSAFRDLRPFDGKELDNQMAGTTIASIPVHTVGALAAVGFLKSLREPIYGIPRAPFFLMSFFMIGSATLLTHFLLNGALDLDGKITSQLG